MKRLIVTAFVFVACHQSSLADQWKPPMYCSKPIKPIQFSSSWDRESFVRDVEEYKRCIEDYVEEQEDSIEVHSKAAEEAIDEWNRFVNYDLQ